MIAAMEDTNMTKQKAFKTAVAASKKSPRYVVYDGEEFGADSCGQGGFQVAREDDLEGFYQGCPIVACFEHGHFQE